MKRKYTRRQIPEVKKEEEKPSVPYSEITIDQAIKYFLIGEPCEVMVKSCATDVKGQWIPFDMIWIQFQGKNLKFRKKNETT